MSDQTVNEIKSKMLEVVRLMNACQSEGIRIEFAVGQDQSGKHTLASFKALKEMKLD